MDSRSLWAATASGDNSARDALLVENLSLVHHVARQLSRSLAVEADFDELVSAGTIGLMTAVRSFDARRGLAFSTFAVPRIRGSILDELRRQDHVPRSVRRKARDISRARELLMRQLGRMPEDSEMAHQLDTDVQTLWRWQAEVEGAVHLSLTSTAGDDGSTVPTRAELLSNEEEAADERLSREDEVALLREAILRLNDQERTVLSLYYFEELKSADIADVLGISESRVSQIRSKALARLRTELAPMRAAV
ncbi:MAG TPA: FliA/WhiG family RNA polymerase sigma factor [Gemmatimonadaceae bacterium]|nr:FliA/WhiG family RNA polymerase sigma factor [Gemmatimonadaceae bacterium]